MDGWMNEMKIIEETLEKRLMSLRSESSPGLRGSAAFRQFQGSQSSTKIGCHQGIWKGSLAPTIPGASSHRPDGYPGVQFQLRVSTPSHNNQIAISSGAS